MDFQLSVVRGRSATNVLKLADGVTTVGRQEDCQLRINSSQVSRKHCEIFEKKGLLLVKDLGSSNGTFVNGKRIAEQRVLEPGDELTVGSVTFKVEKPGQAVAAAVAAGSPAGGAADAEAEADADEVVVADAMIDEGGDDEFEIDFDDDPGTVTAATAPAKPKAPPAPTPPAGVPAAKPAAAAKAEAPVAEPPPPAPAGDAISDEDVADFLLDLKIDDD